MASERRTAGAARAASAPGYGVELRLENRLVVIVGGGPIAMRKLPDLLAAGARISLIDPAPLVAMPQHAQLAHQRRCYLPEDLEAARLVFAATDDPLVNARVADDAAALGILCCRVDSAAASDFSIPARLLRPPLTFSVSTGGASPAMAAALRDLLGEMIPFVWQTATELAAAIRRKILTEPHPIPYNHRVLLQLIEQGLLECLEQSDRAGIDRLLLKHFGVGFSLQDLQFTLPEGTP